MEINDETTTRQLRLLTYNIQVGIKTSTFPEYVTGGWKHLLPSRARQQNLEQIASLLAPYDIVALQEVDRGSMRTSFINQVEYLATKANFPFSYHQLNRNLGRFAQHGNGVLSRFEPSLVVDYKLPGFVPGRGAILIQLGQGENSLAIVVMHLALSRRAQRLQLSYIMEFMAGYKHFVLMGDLNCVAENLVWFEEKFAKLGLQSIGENMHTFPSWRPRRGIDHVIVSSELQVKSAEVLNCVYSDHRPIAVDIVLPFELQRLSS